MAKKQNFIYAIGKRRSSSARIRLYKGKGENTVNNISLESYFPGKIDKAFYSQPLSLAGISDKYYFTAKIMGGGKRGQLEALIHGLSRAISKAGSQYRGSVKKVGLLTRDTRIRQRRMVGMGGKSRRKKQSPKR